MRFFITIIPISQFSLIISYYTLWQFNCKHVITYSIMIGNDWEWQREVGQARAEGNQSRLQNNVMYIDLEPDWVSETVVDNLVACPRTEGYVIDTIFVLVSMFSWLTWHNKQAFQMTQFAWSLFYNNTSYFTNNHTGGGGIRSKTICEKYHYLYWYITAGNQQV